MQAVQSLTSTMQQLTVADNAPKSLPSEIVEKLCELVASLGEQIPPPEAIGDVVAYIEGVQKGKRRVFLLTNENLGFSGSQGSHFYKAFMCRFSPTGTVLKTKELVAMTFPKDVDNSKNRITMMQTLASKELFPKNYAFYCTRSTHVVFQEKAECDLFSLYEKHNGLHALPFEQKISFARSLLRAACALKDKKILHRDVKLDNILICSDNKAKLSDFGSACLIDDAEAKKRIWGTTNILAPELVRYLYLGGNKPHINFATDTWSFGLIFALFSNEGLFEFEAKLYDFLSLGEKKKAMLQVKALLEKNNPTRDESERIACCFRSNDIRLSPTTPKMMRNQKLEECIRKVDDEIDAVLKRVVT